MSAEAGPAVSIPIARAAAALKLQTVLSFLIADIISSPKADRRLRIRHFGPRHQGYISSLDPLPTSER